MERLHLENGVLLSSAPVLYTSALRNLHERWLYGTTSLKLLCIRDLPSLTIKLTRSILELCHRENEWLKQVIQARIIVEVHIAKECAGLQWMTATTYQLLEICHNKTFSE